MRRRRKGRVNHCCVRRRQQTQRPLPLLRSPPMSLTWCAVLAVRPAWSLFVVHCCSWRPLVDPAAVPQTATARGNQHTNAEARADKQERLRVQRILSFTAVAFRVSVSSFVCFCVLCVPLPLPLHGGRPSERRCRTRTPDTLPPATLTQASFVRILCTPLLCPSVAAPLCPPGL